MGLSTFKPKLSPAALCRRRSPSKESGLSAAEVAREPSRGANVDHHLALSAVAARGLQVAVGDLGAEIAVHDGPQVTVHVRGLQLHDRALDGDVLRQRALREVALDLHEEADALADREQPCLARFFL